MRIPKHVRWLFWEIDPATIDAETQADYVIARVVEHGTLADLKWLVRRYGLERIHQFFREAASPELSARTLAFWRAFYRASNERWREPPSWRRRSAAPWPS